MDFLLNSLQSSLSFLTEYILAHPAAVVLYASAFYLVLFFLVALASELRNPRELIVDGKFSFRRLLFVLVNGAAIPTAIALVAWMFLAFLGTLGEFCSGDALESGSCGATTFSEGLVYVFMVAHTLIVLFAALLIVWAVVYALIRVLWFVGVRVVRGIAWYDEAKSRLPRPRA